MKEINIVELVEEAANAELLHLFTPHCNEVISEASMGDWHVLCDHDDNFGGITAYKLKRGQVFDAENRNAMEFAEYETIANFNEDDEIEDCEEKYLSAAQTFLERIKNLRDGEDM